MIMEKVLSSAEEYLTYKTVRDVVIGICHVACELDNGAVGVAYMLRNDLTSNVDFSFAQETIGRPALEIAKWAVSGANNPQRGVGVAVLAAISHALEIPDDTDDFDRPFNLEIKPDDTIGMVGLIRKRAEQISKRAGKMIIFDETLAREGNEPSVLPTALQPQLLPECDIVILSGSTVINQTVDSLLAMCTKSREIVVVGSSTPMFPKAWSGSGVTRLAGAWWKNGCKNDLFRMVTLATSGDKLDKFMIRKNYIL
jgi:hypothetical protein